MGEGQIVDSKGKTLCSLGDDEDVLVADVVPGPVDPT